MLLLVCAESGLVTGLATKSCPPVPPPQLRLSRVARALHAASTESQPPAVAPGSSVPTAPAPEAPRVTEPSSNSDDEWDALLDAHGLTGTAAAVAQPAAAAGASRRARDKRRRRQRKASKLHVEGHLVRSHCRFVLLLAVVFTLVGLLWLCARFRGSCHLIGPRVLSCGFGCLWHCATALAWFLVQLPVRLPCALCGVLRGLLDSSGAHFPGWLGGPLTWRSAHTVTGPAAPDLTLLLIGAETAGGIMTKLIVRNIIVLGALNSDVYAKLPFLLESFLADVLCCPALAICARPVFSTSA